MVERPALFALVQAGRIDGGRARAAEEEALEVQYTLFPPLHDPLAQPYPVDVPDDDGRLLACLAHRRLGIFLAGIDQAADHHPEWVTEGIGWVVDRRIVHLE